MDSAFVTLVVRVVPCGEAGAYYNAAEISDFQDENGDDPLFDDIDSDPDSDPDNDGEVVDDDISSIPPVDEDDHDIDEIMIYDLALRKTADDLGPFLPARRCSV